MIALFIFKSRLELRYFVKGHVALIVFRHYRNLLLLDNEQSNESSY